MSIANDLISFSKLKCVIFIVDDTQDLGILRKDLKHFKLQSKVILENDLWQRQNLTRVGNCGVFLKVKSGKSKYLNNVFQLNNVNPDIFKTLHWFIFLSKESILVPVFRYDSNVYLITGGGKDVRNIVETYSIEEGVQVNRDVGTWSSKHGIGKV